MIAALSHIQTQQDEDWTAVLARQEAKILKKEVRLDVKQEAVMAALLALHDQWHHPAPYTLLNKIKHADASKLPAALRTVTHTTLRWLVGQLHCESCAAGAQRAAPKSKRTHIDAAERRQRAQNSATLHLQADLSGPHHGANMGCDSAHPLAHVSARPNNTWTLVVIEENTKLIYTASFDDKDETKRHLKAAVAWMQQHLCKRVVEIITDNGTEFKGKEGGVSMDEWARNNGIALRTTLAYEKVKNSLAERTIGVINAHARVLLHRARLPAWYHPYATAYTAHTLNHTPRAASGDRAPLSYCPNASGTESADELLMFGERVTALNVNTGDRASKYAPVSAAGIYMGIDRGTGEHTVLVPRSNNREATYFLLSKNVRRTRRYFYAHWDGEWDASPAASSVVRPSADSVASETATAPLPVQENGGERAATATTTGPPPMPELTPATRDPLTPTSKEDGSTHSTPSSASSSSSTEENGGEESQTTLLANHQGELAYVDDEGEEHYVVKSTRPSKKRGYVWVTWANYVDETLEPESMLDPPSHDDTDVERARVSAISNISPTVLKAIRGLGAVSAIIKGKDGHERIILEPKNVKEMLAHPMRKECMEACKKELDSLAENNTYTPIPASMMPAFARAIGCQWVWKFKVKDDGSIDKVKARLVARGDQQREGIDYGETYAPTVRMDSIRLFFAIITQCGMGSQQMDYSSAFLHGKVEEELYMLQPPMFYQPLAPGETRPAVLRLNKSLYGIKQAPRIWNKTLDATMRSIGFRALVCDPGFYARQTRTKRLILISLYVDDKAIAVHPADEEEWGEVMDKLRKEYAYTANETCEWILRMSVRHYNANRTLDVSMQRYIEEKLTVFAHLIDRYGTTRTVTNPASTTKLHSSGIPPVSDDDDGNEELSEKDDGELLDAQGQNEYAQLIGALNYCVLLLRPDACDQVGKLSRYGQAPRLQHMRAAVRVLQYLGDNKERCMRFEHDSSKADGHFTVECYTDSDWASCLDDRASTTGTIVLVNGNAVTWSSKKQKTVAQSSMEAEYVAAAESTNSAYAVYQLLHELHTLAPTFITVDKVIPTYIDNTSAIATTKEGAPHRRSKHIDIKHHVIRERVRDGVVKVVYIPTRHQLADILTKRLPDLTHHAIRDHLLANKMGCTRNTLAHYRHYMDEHEPLSRRKKQRLLLKS